MCEGFLILDWTTFENVYWKREYAVATEALKKLEQTSELEGFWQSNRGCRDLNLKYLLMVFFSLIHSIIINTTRLMCKISTIAYATSDLTNITHIFPLLLTSQSAKLCFLRFSCYGAKWWYVICSTVSSSPLLSFCRSLLWPFSAWWGHGLQSGFHAACTMYFFQQWRTEFSEARLWTQYESSSFIEHGTTVIVPIIELKMGQTFLFLFMKFDLWYIICHLFVFLSGL